MKDKDNILLKMYKLEQLIIALLVVISVVLIIGVSKMYSNTDSKEEGTSEYNTTYDVSMFKEISASDLKSETKDKLSVVFIGRETCGWCAAFLPNLWDAQKEFGYKTLYIDIAKIIDFSNSDVIDETSYNILMELTGDDYDGYMEENFGATPMILIMKDNKIVGAQTGYSEYSEFVKVLNNAGITK